MMTYVRNFIEIRWKPMKLEMHHLNVQSNFFCEKLETFLHQRQKAVQPLLHHLRP